MTNNGKYYILYIRETTKNQTTERRNLIIKKLKKLIAGALAVAVSAVCMMPLASSAAGPKTFNFNKDPNGDGSFDFADATYIILYLAGRIEPTDLSALDVDGNGVISRMDVYCVQLHEAGLWG